MNRERHYMFYSMCILMFSITACSNGAKDVGNAVKGTLTVGFDQDFPPMALLVMMEILQDLIWI